MLSGELTGKGGPEGGDWRTLPDEDKDDGRREGYNEHAAVHEDAPKLDDGENSILEQNATDPVYQTLQDEGRKKGGSHMEYFTLAIARA